jgi:serine/threonine protein kinase
VLSSRYRIERLLGMGGMGHVYLATDLTLEEPRALKVVRDLLRRDPGSLAKLKKEARTCLKLHHDNIVAVHHFDDADEVSFLVMEYVEGETLADRIVRETSFAEQEVSRIGTEICRALEYAHGKGVIHRDIKPANILLGTDGAVKVADFGIARVAMDSSTRLTGIQTSGTLQYMSPEQVMGEADTRSDLYSLGVVLYELLSGEMPFTTGDITRQILEKRPAALEGVSEELGTLVLRLLEKEPADRYATATELLAELDGAGRSAGQNQGMALIKCYECEKEISDKSPACPHCGAPKEEQPPQSDPGGRKSASLRSASATATVTAAQFYLAANGVTVMCPDADVGQTGEVNGIVYTKRSRSQIKALVAADVTP